jgi:hypothetical protein
MDMQHTFCGSKTKESPMDIFLAVERAFHLIPQISLEVARDRLEQKKVSLVSGTLGR